MQQKSKSKPAPKAGATKTAKPKAASAKTAKPKSAPKKASGAANHGAPAPKRAKTKNIFAKKGKTAGSRAKSKTAAVTPNRDLIAHNAPLIDALDQALSGIRVEQAPLETTASGERRATGNFDPAGNDQGRASAWRPSLGEAGSEPADAPARINKLVPTNAVHTTKRRMKRNTWQGPVLGLGAVAAVLGVLILGNNSEPPDVSPLEYRAQIEPDAGLPMAAQVPDARDPLDSGPEHRPQIPARLAQPALPPGHNDRTAGQTTPQTTPPRELRVLELVEMERMLARLDMEPSQPDGVVDQQTETAIRMYQQIAGLPVDGAPSPELLDDMREVVKLMDGAN